MRRVILVVCTCLCMALGVGCSCGGGGGGEQGDGGTADAPPGEFPPYEHSLSESELNLAGWLAATLRTVLLTFDLDDDGVAGEADLAAVEGCVARGATVASDPRCDLTGDGVIDEKDTTLFLVIVGRARPRAAEDVAAGAARLMEYADGTLDATDFAGVFPDVTGDGVVTAADFTLAATLLAAGAGGAADVNGDGRVDRDDPRALIERIVDEYFGGPAAAPDLNGDGVVDELDVVLLNAVATYSLSRLPGVLDVNRDGRVDVDDYCHGAAHEIQPDFYRFLLPEAAGAAAFAASLPRILQCREDGRSIYRYDLRHDTRVTLRVLPANLYLESVAAIPSGYHPENAADLAGKQLWVVSTTPGAVRVLGLDLPPVLPGFRSDADLAGVALDSDAFGADDWLLLPGEAVPLSSLVELQDNFQPLGWRVARAQVRKNSLRDHQKQAVADMGAKMAAIRDRVNAIIQSGCPCDLSLPERVGLTRELDQLEHGLSVAEKLAGIWFENEVLSHQRFFDYNQMCSNHAAQSWEGLAEATWDKAMADVMLYVADTAAGCLDAKQGGIYGELVSKLFELETEIVKDATAKDDFLTAEDGVVGFANDNLRDRIIPNLAADVAWSRGGLEKWYRGRSVQQAMLDLGEKLKRYGAPTPSLDKLEKTMWRMQQGADRKINPTILIDALTIMLDKEFRALRANAFDAYFDSVVAAQEYDASTYRVAQWEAVFAQARDLRAEADSLRGGLLSAFDQAGCELEHGASEKTCWTNHKDRVAVAQQLLDSARIAHQAARAAALDRAFDNDRGACEPGGGSTDTPGAFFGGGVTESAARAPARLAASPATCDALHPALGDAAAALEDHRDALRAFKERCTSEARLGKTFTMSDLRAAIDQVDAELKAAQEAYEAEVKAAGEELAACLAALGAAGACTHSAQFEDDPFTYLLECLDCTSVPSLSCRPVDTFTPPTDPDGIAPTFTINGVRVMYFAPQATGWWNLDDGTTGTNSMPWATFADGYLNGTDSMLLYYTSTGGLNLVAVNPATLANSGMTVGNPGKTGAAWGGITSGYQDLWWASGGQWLEVWRGVSTPMHTGTTVTYYLPMGATARFVTWVPGAQRAVIADTTAGNIHLMDNSGTNLDAKAVGKAWRGAGAGTWWLGATNEGQFGGSALVSSAVLYCTQTMTVAETVTNPNGTGDFWGADIWTDGSVTHGAVGAVDGFMYFGVDQTTGARCTRWHDTTGHVQDVVVVGSAGKLVLSIGDHLQYVELADVKCTP